MIMKNIKKQTIFHSIVISLLVSSPGQAGTINMPAPNPWLADSPYAISHHNPAQTDVTDVDGPSISKKLTLADAQTVPLLWCSAPTYEVVNGETIVIASNPLGLIKVRATGDDFSLVSNLPYPNREDVHLNATDEKILGVMADIDKRRRQKQD